jgi:hypothetical protein
MAMAARVRNNVAVAPTSVNNSLIDPPRINKPQDYVGNNKYGHVYHV